MYFIPPEFAVESKVVQKNVWPAISVVVPTLNSQRTLEVSLNSIAEQDYPGKVEIVLADGGSIDATLKIAKSFGVKIVHNNLKTGEAGKAVGVAHARGKILAFVDSDNVLPDKNWLRRMVKPFLDDPDIIASEPLYFSYRRKDHWLTRYFTLLGMGDPLNLFIGNYDRYSFVTDKWTGLEIPSEDKGEYLLLKLRNEIPTIGANGFLVRKSVLAEYSVKDYLFDIDVVRLLAQKTSVKVAKVKIGIVHLFAGNIATFVRKQKRRIRDYFYFQKSGFRVEPDIERLNNGKKKFILSCVTILPLLLQTGTGFLRKRDTAWLFHPLACWITLFVYTVESLRQPFTHGQLNRKHWSQ